MFNFYWRKKYKKIRRKYVDQFENLQFDTNEVDAMIEKLANSIYFFYRFRFFEENKIINKFAFCASLLYDVGGHTACLYSLADSLYSINKKRIPLFLSSKEKCYSLSALTMNKLEKFVKTDGINFDAKFYVKDVFLLYNKIVSELPEYLFVFIHPDDIVFSLVLFLLKKTTPIKLIFFNHASHYPSLGMSFSHFIWEPLPSTLKTTRDCRHITVKSRVMGLPSGRKENYRKIHEDGFSIIRSSLGLENENFLTMSGGASYKFFDGVHSEYFLMVRKVLSLEPKLFHVILSNFSDKQMNIINDIFKNNSELKKRLIIIPLRPDFEPFFRSADVFVDSFPVSSALTQLDLMKNRTASVVKVNTDNPEKSFHEYLPKDYPYMFETVEGMIGGILLLLNNPLERKKAIDMNYQHWLENYESDAIINNVLNLVNELKDEV